MLAVRHTTDFHIIHAMIGVVRRRRHGYSYYSDEVAVAVGD